MKKIGIFYGSSTGTCEDLANRIAGKLGVPAADVYSADKLTADKVKVIAYSAWATLPGATATFRTIGMTVSRS